MRISKFLVSFLIFSLAITTPAISQASFFIDNDNKESKILLVKIDENADAKNIFSNAGIYDFEKLNLSDFYKISITSDFQKEKLKNNSYIKSVEEDKKTYISFTPNDPFYGLQSYLTESNIPSIWDKTIGSPEIIVAVIDTGVDYLHEDLRDIMWQGAQGQMGYDFVNKDTDPMDDHYHGTVVAGIIAAKQNNTKGITGIANIKIMAIKSMLATGDGFVSDIVQGVTYAADNGARIINLSLGLPEESAALNDAVNYAYQKNVLIVAATGNKGMSTADSPARHPLAIGVGALNSTGTLADYSNYGTGTSLVVFGDNIYSTSWNKNNNVNYYEYQRGTSFATPQVTGTAALLLSYDSSLSVDQLRKRILGTAKKIAPMGGADYSLQYGYGELNAYAAFSYDKYSPNILDAKIYRIGSNAYQITGKIIDDANPSNILTTTTNSNIKLVKYKVDNNAFQTLNTSPANSFLLNFYTSDLGAGEHLITLEATDTSGNIATFVLNTTNSLVGSVSSNPADYKAQLLTQSSYPILTAGQKQNMFLTFKNTGKSIWTKDKVRLGTSSPRDRISYLADSSWMGGNRVAMKESVVAPGETATFEFTITAPNYEDSFNEYFNLVAEGLAWFNDIGLFWKVTIEKPSYHAQYLNQSPFVNLTPGSTTTLWVEYKNTGSQIWNASNVHLGTSNPLDRNSVFYNAANNSGWKSRNRIALEQASVAIGETGRFKFIIQAPQTPGTYYEYFRPVVDGFTWMEDVGLYWKIIVQ